MKILIVEDDCQLAEMHAHFVGNIQNCEVVGIATTIQQAKDMTQFVDIDLALVDNFLPDGLGIDLVLHWLADAKPIRSIIVTAANDAGTINTALIRGAFDYLVKPINYQRLTESIKRFKEYKLALTQHSKFQQHQLDDVLNQHTKASEHVDEFLTKELLSLFPHGHTELSSAEVALQLNVSKSTARRYLDKLVERRLLNAFLAHGKVGRPTRLYCRPSPSE